MRHKAAIIRRAFPGILTGVFGCAISSDFPPSVRDHFFSPNVKHGIYVSGVPNSKLGGNLNRHDVVVALDGAPLHEARELYQVLSDGEDHKLTVWPSGGSRTRTVKARVSYDDLRAFGFAEVESLQSTPPHGQGRGWGLAVRESTFVVPETGQHWNVPHDMWGSPYIIIDFAAGHNISSSFPLGSAEIQTELTADLFILSVTGSEPGAGAPQPPAGWSDNPRVFFATTVSNRVGEWGFSGYLASYPIYYFPNILVVDCHGVIRWSKSDVWNDTLSEALPRALRFVKLLEEEKQDGKCWEIPPERNF
jgi:hypothetical protein